MRIILFLSVLVLFSSSAISDAAKILFYSSARTGQSHIFFMGKIADVLAEAGHNVTYYQQHMYNSVNKPGVKVAKFVVRPANFKIEEISQASVWEAQSAKAGLDFMRRFGEAQSTACESQLEDEKYLQELKSGNWDIGVAEWFDYCALAIFHKIGIKKHITTSALMQTKSMMKAFGLPTSLGVIPSWDEKMSSPPTYGERIRSLFKTTITLSLTRSFLFDNLNKMIKEKVDPNLDVLEKLAQSSYVFMNVDEHLTTQTPVSSKFVFLGSGLNDDSDKNGLNEDFRQILSSASEGVVVVSFGTVARSINMPDHIRNALLETFALFPKVSFIWKYEQEDDVAKNLTNVYKRTWIPQHDLLAHKNVRAFLTHGGLNSVSEAAEIGVPSICTPLFADQPTNCNAAEVHGISITMDKKTFNTKDLTAALKKVLYEDGHRNKAKAISKMITSKPFNSRERIIGYVAHALQNDVHESLDLPERKLSTIQYYNLDYIVVVGLLFLITFWISLRILRFFGNLTVKMVITKKKLE